MAKLVIPIRGMHCRSCEILLEENIKEVCGVQSVQVSFKHANAIINYKGNVPTNNALALAVQNAGYEIGTQGNIPWFSRNANDYFQLAAAGAILLILYFLAKSLGLFDIAVDSGNGSVWIVLLVGLVAGFSSCMALIGGLVLGISARHSELHPESTPAQRFRPHLFFNAGRIAGYATFGGIIGFLGSAFQLSGSVLGIITIIVGVVMIFLGLKLIEIFPALKNKTITLPKSLSRLLGIKKETKEYSHKNAMVAGALTFFLPCGFTQAMQLYAMSTGSVTQGALIMFMFALGTAPGLLGVGGLASIFKGQKARTFFMVAGLAVIILGVFNISNASRLISWPTRETSTKEVQANGEYQEVRMTQGNAGYTPSQFTVELGRPVRWIVTSESQFSCASSLIMPEYSISKALKSGENIIEFTPTKVGKISFSCSMGMYRGDFTVVESAKTDTKTIRIPTAEEIQAKLQAQIPVANTLRAVYTRSEDLQPNTFIAKVGESTSLEIEVNDNGSGCMSTVTIPGLTNQVELLEKGKKIILKFIPQKAGEYRITCAMGVPRGVITVE